MVEISTSAARAWLSASQLALGLGLVSVALGALGVVRFSGRLARPAPVSSRVSSAVASPVSGSASLTGPGASEGPAQDAESDARRNSAPRLISEAQAARLTAALKAVPGPPVVNIQTLTEPEAAAYGAMIVRVIEGAGYRGQTETLPHPDPPPRGLHLLLKPSSTRAEAIRYAFEALHIPVIVGVSDTPVFDAVIVVGLKP